VRAERATISLSSRMRGVAIESQRPSPSPAPVGDQPAASGGLGPRWLRSIATASERVPSQLAIGLAGLLLALMVLLELRSAGGVPSIPLYFLLPVSLIAWFAGWRPALLAATAAFAVTLAITLLGGTHTNSSAIVFLLRLLTVAFAAATARALSTARQIVDLFYRNPGWRAMHRPIRVGTRLLVVPILEIEDPGQAIELDPGVLPLYIQPGMAFGTASHPTTRMCLELLEQFMRSGATVLDVGCGTGILAIAAAKLGATRVYAIDTAARAIKLAHVNLAHNGLSDRVTLIHGSFDIFKPEVLLDSFNITDDSGSPATPPTGHRFDLILANLLAGVIKDLLQSGIPALLSPGGVLITSGIRSSELASVQAAIHEAGLRLDQSVEEDGWCALAARRQ
jgi:ribosomal protein L11 methyltransferase